MAVRLASVHELNGANQDLAPEVNRYFGVRLKQVMNEAAAKEKR